MKRFSTYALIASLALSGASVALALDPATPSQTDQTAGQPADESAQREVRSTLAKIVNEAVETTKFDNLNGYLAKADKDRLADMKKMNVDDLNNVIKQFRADFKNKYNQDFDIQAALFNDTLIMAGQDKKSAIATIPNADLTNAAAPAGGNANAMANAAGLTLNLVNEGHIMNAWRLDIPDQITADQLKQNLLKHIQMLDDQKATWPSDVNAAYRATAFHMLQSFTDSSLASER